METTLVLTDCVAKIVGEDDEVLMLSSDTSIENWVDYESVEEFLQLTCCLD